MAMRIRLSRAGAKKRPFYHIVAADSRNPRDGRFVEKLGVYNPMVPKDHADRLVIKEERIKYWLGVGALPTDRLARLFSDRGLTKKPPVPKQTRQHIPKEQRRAEKKKKEGEEGTAPAAGAAAPPAAKAAAPKADAAPAAKA
ncbi:MAG: 30S ribosomal protein S16 [Rhodospirillales bacterium]|nr:30S ribosomal protein S16 [Rhodospirillales bacterium]